MRQVPDNIDFHQLVTDAKFIGLRMHLAMGMRTVVLDRGGPNQQVEMQVCWTLAVSSRSENSKRWKHQITLVAEEDEGPEKLLRDVAALYELGNTPIRRS